MGRFELALDSTKITSYLTCPTMFNYEHEVGIVKTGRDRTALDKGTVMHGLVERYYKKLWEGETTSNAMGFSLSQLGELKKEVDLTDEVFSLLSRRFIEYCSNYKDDKLQIESSLFNKPSIEVGFSVPILDTPDFYFVLEGRIDLIATLGGIKLFIDHKTQERKKDLYPYSIQFMNYALVTGLRHGMVNYIGLSKEVNKDTFRRKLIYYGELKLQQWKKKVIDIFFKVLGDKKRDQNFAMCGGMYGYPCQYHELCEQTDPSIRNGLIQVQFEKRAEWKPWRLGEEDA